VALTASNRHLCVTDCNVTRRNMSTGARAMATALVLIADDPERRKNHRWRRDSLVDNQRSLDNAASWSEYLRRAGIILDYKPDLVEHFVC
jgi:hypothetical protein